MTSRKPKIGLLGTTMSGFDAVLEVADEVRDMSQYSTLLDRVAKSLSVFGDVVGLGIAGNESDAVEKRDTLIREDCDLVVIWPFNYTLDVVPLKVAAGLKTPLVLLNTMPRSAIAAREDFGKVMENNAIACLPTITNVLIKNNIPFHLVSGEIDKPGIYDEIGRLARGAAVARKLRTARIGTIGYSYPGISALSVDEAVVVGQFGVTLVPLNIKEIAREYQSVPPTAVEEYFKKLSKTVTLTDIEPSAVKASIRVRPVFEKLVEKYQLDALAQLCQLLVLEPQIGIVPCYANTALTDGKIPVTCECDIATAIAMLILQEFAGDVLFLEFYTQDFERGLAMFSHCGQGNLNLAKPGCPVTVRKHPSYGGSYGKGISYEYLTRTGIVTYACLTYIRGKWRMVAGCGESVEMDQRPTTTVQMYFKFKGSDFNAAYHRFCLLGGIHHLAFGYGNHLAELKATCQMLDIEFRTPDE